MADMKPHAGRRPILAPYMLAGAAGIIAGASIWGWARYGSDILIDRMLTAIANCF